MLGNAVSAAVERLYAGSGFSDDRRAVQRVSPVSSVAAVERVRAVAEEDPRSTDSRTEREQSARRQALAQGVKAVFESSVMGELTNADGSTAAGLDADKPAADRPKTPPTDPVLEEAILRFVHTMFRTIAEIDGKAEQDGEASDDATRNGSSRSALAARIERFAQRIADGRVDLSPPPAATVGSSPQPVVGAEGTPTPMQPDRDLGRAFAEVMQALKGSAVQSDGAPQPMRSDLVALVQRLAQAMNGAPPVDPGLPTQGGLLSERA